MNYYNEIDRFAANWLRNLIRDGHLPKGDVDERSIVDVRPGDLRGYHSAHWFAGIGGWPYGLQPGRVGILRGAGNAIVPQVAVEFIRASEDARIQSLGG